MTKVKSITDIASLYEAVRTKGSEVIEEKSQKFPKGTFPQSTKEVKATTDFENSGPNKALDKSKIKKKKKKTTKTTKTTRKVVTDSINSFMKSEFDKLFENVMGDDESSFDVTPSMGPEGGESGDLGVDLGSEEGAGEGEVTITLSKDLAQQLHDVLMGVLGGEEGAGEEDQELEDLGIDMGGEEEGEEGGEDEEKLNDATEMTELKDTAGHGLMGKNNKAPGNVTNKSGGKASHTTATDKVGNETKGHPMDLKSGLQDKNNKVDGQTVTNKVGKSLFQ